MMRSKKVTIDVGVSNQIILAWDVDSKSKLELTAGFSGERGNASIPRDKVKEMCQVLNEYIKDTEPFIGGRD